MTDRERKMIVLCKHSTGIMKNVFYNIYLYLTGKVQKTSLNDYAGYNHSKCRFIYTKVNGQTVETVIDENGKVVFTGVLA